MIKSRIKIIDGFRAIAILAVILFHFFSKPDISYPYERKYDYFKYGYLGVQFFFIISGFVISYTLVNTTHILTFWKKRWIRLFPSMLVASLIIFSLFQFVKDRTLYPDSRIIMNFIPGLTFIDPHFFNILFLNNSGFQLNYLNGSFWSLWPEVQFYLFASFLYFYNTKDFVRLFLKIAGIIIAINWFVGNINGSNIFHLNVPFFLKWYQILFNKIFTLPTYLIYFSTGVIFFQLYQCRETNHRPATFIKLAAFFFLTYCLYQGVKWDVRFFLLLMFALFLVFIYRPSYLAFFESKVLVNFGVASYFVYLVHEPIGIFFIKYWASTLYPVEFIFVFVLTVVIVRLSMLYTKTIDARITKKLKKWLIAE